MNCSCNTKLVDGWIDIHSHFAWPPTEAAGEAMWSALQRDHWTGPKPNNWTLEERIAYMDRVGIGMQMLSNVKESHAALREANAYGASLVAQHPSRFGLLAALPTDDAECALEEVARADDLKADGFACYCQYNGVFLSDQRLEPLWEELNRRAAVVFVHPNHAVPGQFSRPGVLLEVLYQTTSVVVDMLYAGIFRRHPAIRFVLAHCGGALPALSGRLQLLHGQPWIPNPQEITHAEMREHLEALYLDTAMTGGAETLAPALEMTRGSHLVYGSDCGAPCTADETAIANIRALLQFSGLSAAAIDQIGKNAARLFPSASCRMSIGAGLGPSISA